MKLLQGKLTYANVVSTLCLVLLVGGGSALAANQLGKNTVGTKQLKKGAVTAAKIKKGAITGSQINLSSLGSVPNASHATTADSAANAAHATTADSASPEAFAFIEENGNVLDVRSKGLASADVSHPLVGTYCITVPGFQPRGGQVTPQFHGNPAQSATFSLGGSGACPSPAVQVTTSKIEGAGGETGPHDMPFYVVFYR